MSNDSLYRISLKCLITNEHGEILVVKETGRDVWDLPGGGMEHNESLVTAIGRELYEEAGYKGGFAFQPIFIDEPSLLRRGIWQVRIVLKVIPELMNFSAGPEADEIAFMNADVFKNAEHEMERKIYQYSKNS